MSSILQLAIIKLFYHLVHEHFLRVLILFFNDWSPNSLCIPESRTFPASINSFFYDWSPNSLCIPESRTFPASINSFFYDRSPNNLCIPESPVLEK